MPLKLHTGVDTATFAARTDAPILAARRTAPEVHIPALVVFLMAAQEEPLLGAAVHGAEFAPKQLIHGHGELPPGEICREVGVQGRG